jgi:hypothetical protein
MSRAAISPNGRVLRHPGDLEWLERRRLQAADCSPRARPKLDLDRKRLGEIRQQIQTNLYDTLPGEVMSGTAFEADERCIRTPGKK